MNEVGLVLGVVANGSTELTLLNVRWTLEREGEITVTWPEGHVAADSLAPVLTAA